MFMKDNKKQAVSLIMSRLGSKDEKVAEAPTEDGIEQDSSIPLESAAEEIISAFETKNPKALVEALKYFLEMCDTPEPTEE